jgi:hypothetical protein
MLFLVACGEGDKESSTDLTDTSVETDCPIRIFYVDEDGDGYGDATQWMESCEQPSGTVYDSTDCDDSNPNVNISATETCNELDDNCDGVVDNGVGSMWYADVDGDGFGNPNNRQQACTAPDGWVDNGDDCQDGNPDVHPDVVEVCDGVDNNCDDQVDEGVATTYYADNDFDTYGDPNNTVESCSPVPGMVEIAGDCNDGSAAVYPGAIDGCNAYDDDCDGMVDEDVKAGWSLVTIDTQSMTVYEIDISNANVTPISTIQSGLTGINSMDVWEDGTAIVHSNAGSVLYSFDVCQGTGTLIGPTGISVMGGISFGSGNQLYGLNAGDDDLMALDITTGAGSVVGSLGNNIGNNGMAYDCSTDTLYGADAALNRIFTVDPTTGLASNFVSTSVPFQGVGLEFDHATGLLLASTGSHLYTIDPATGSSNLVGAFNGLLADDLAFYPTCP